MIEEMLTCLNLPTCGHFFQPILELICLSLITLFRYKIETKCNNKSAYVNNKTYRLYLNKMGINQS